MRWGRVSVTDSGPGPDRSSSAAIDDSSEGGWLLTTETGSLYLVDLDHRTITRCPDPASEAPEPRLRRDYEPLPLQQVIACEPGASAYFLITVEPGVVTLRITAPVVELVRQAPC